MIKKQRKLSELITEVHNEVLIAPITNRIQQNKLVRGKNNIIYKYWSNGNKIKVMIWVNNKFSSMWIYDCKKHSWCLYDE